ncbi:dynein heavy chain protein [Besnoitia besnoiti]|uniref:Dynein heavy chain protein n=1 Tax=Besnoitia besnoiti TaxID=94643 RepID=A0A2A9MK81_BESBE|nr:dynein heavy chain protein [Besnoitia besnoiti]PFH38385.1 dynein heavy chain protein [Besnoitia besnoiti]
MSGQCAWHDLRCTPKSGRSVSAAGRRHRRPGCGSRIPSGDGLEHHPKAACEDVFRTWIAEGERRDQLKPAGTDLPPRHVNHPFLVGFSSRSGNALRLIEKRVLSSFSSTSPSVGSRLSSAVSVKNHSGLAGATKLDTPSLEQLEETLWGCPSHGSARPQTRQSTDGKPTQSCSREPAAAAPSDQTSGLKGANSTEFFRRPLLNNARSTRRPLSEVVFSCTARRPLLSAGFDGSSAPLRSPANASETPKREWARRMPLSSEWSPVAQQKRAKTSQGRASAGQPIASAAENRAPTGAAHPPSSCAPALSRETRYNEPLFAFKDDRIKLSLEEFDDPDAYDDLAPEEWVRLCAARRRMYGRSQKCTSGCSTTETPPALDSVSQAQSACDDLTHEEKPSPRTSNLERALPRQPEDSSPAAEHSHGEIDGRPHADASRKHTSDVSTVVVAEEADPKNHTIDGDCPEDATVLHFLGGDWVMTPCWVLSYLKGEKRFRVRLKVDGKEKCVRRLSLQFVGEVAAECQERSDRCRRRRHQMHLRQALINLIHSLHDDDFQPLGIQAKKRMLKRLLLKGRGHLRKLDSRYIRNLFDEFQDLHQFALKFAAIRHRTFTLNGTPYAFLSPDKLNSRFGRLFLPLLPPLMKEKGCESIAGMQPLSRTRALLKRSPHFMRQEVAKAFRLNHFIQHQQDHCADIRDVLGEHWRDFIHNETMAALGAFGSDYHFYVDDLEKHLRSDLHKILRKIDIILSHCMLEFIRASIADWRSFFLSFVSDETHLPVDPLLILDVCATDREQELLPFLDLPDRPLYEISASFEPLREAREMVHEVLRAALGEAENYLATFDKFKYLNSAAEHGKNGQHADFDPSDVPRVQAHLEKYHTAMFEIQTECPAEVRLKMVVLDCADVKAKLTARAEALWRDGCEIVAKSVEQQVTSVMNDWSELHDRILAIPATEEELASLKILIAKINELTDPLVAKTKLIHETIDLLASFNFPIDKAVHEEAYKAFSWPLQIKFDLVETTGILEQGRLRFEEKLEVNKAELTKEFGELELELQFIQDEMTVFEQSMEYNKRMLQVQERLLAAKKKAEDFTKAETLFGVEEPSDYSHIDDLLNRFEPFRKLWALAVDFKYGEYHWLRCTITSLDPTEVETSLDQWSQEAYRLRKQFLQESRSTQVDVADALRQAIERFREHLPVIRPLCSEAFLPRHWVDLLRTLNCELDVEEGFSLAQLLESGVQAHLATIEEKSELAQKEFTLKSSLVKMKFEWKPVQLLLVPFKDTHTCVMKGFDVAYALLDDQLVRTQTMRGSRFIRCIEHQSREWEAKLLDTQQALESLQACQRSWMYLEPIFRSEDIAKQIPREAALFREVDNLWRRTVAQAEETPGVLDIAELDNLHHDLTQANAKLAQVMRALNDFLEGKRLIFPRFFFLSNDELLAILSQTSDLSPLQMHLDKCFEGVHRVAFGDRGTTINAIQSAEGEEIPLVRTVALSDGSRFLGAENWLGELESSVSDSLRSVMEAAMKDYPRRARTDWCLRWPGQAVLAVSQLFWTSEVAEAIDAAQLASYLAKCNDQLQGLVRLVRGSLTKLNRLTVTTLLSLDVHARDVVQDLQRAGAASPSDFEWLAQLRLSWQAPGSVTLLSGKPNAKPELQLKVIDAHIFYGFEYLGNSERLVVTPLTDRCYRTLIGAFHLQYGGAPEGPAGTGKTETTKDLAKAAGMKCLVFNCSDGLDCVSIGRFFKGLAASGAWCCFDEFNRINVEVLSVIAQQVHAIQQAIRNQVKTFLFEGTDVRLVPSCAINITMNPGYAGRSDLPDNLKALFRPCAMMIPDYALIAEVVLYASGFEDARNVGRKALGCLRLSSEQLSSQDHYDFGMRALKAVLTAAGHLKQKLGSRFSEEELTLYALEQVSVPKFTPGDVRLFRGIVADLFPDVAPAAEANALLLAELEAAARRKALQPTASFLEKCMQLWNTVKVRHGLMLVGATLTGKTAVLECLADALAEAGKHCRKSGRIREKLGDDHAESRGSADGEDVNKRESSRGKEASDEPDRNRGEKRDDGDGALPMDVGDEATEDEEDRSEDEEDENEEDRDESGEASEYMPCKVCKINPKSITLGQLYGKYDENTQEWTDGILPIVLRKAARRPNLRKRHWVVLDGPVDAIWIENMNTVLDDNKKLCLTSGEIIKLSTLTTMVFEVEDLSAASPATVSRCGMVYLDPMQCGWQPIVLSWIERQKRTRSPVSAALAALAPQEQGMESPLRDLFLHALPVCLQFIRTNCETPVPVSSNW